MKYYLIYKITNLINGKIYIGQTIVPEPVRWQQHIFWAYNNPEQDATLLCRAIKKYGKENFKREILERIPNEELNERETYYIDLFNSTNKEIGYNLSLGGGGHLKFSEEKIIESYNRLKSVEKVAEELGAHKSSIGRRLKALNILLPKTVLQYGLNGVLISVYESFAQAKRITGLDLPKLIPSHHYACGYAWIYKKDEENIKEIIENIKNSKTITKTLCQYDLEGNFIRYWKNAGEASKTLNIDISSIKAAALGNQITAGGYIWFRLNGIDNFEERFEKYLLSSQCCEIEEIDKEGNIIKKYKSSNQAEKELGFSYNDIKRVCDGEKKSTHGRFFQYSNKQKRELIKFGLNMKI